MAATDGSTRTEMKCDDIRHFKETIKTLRALDDKIIYKLNQSVPTKSFQHEVHAEEKCKSLYQDLLQLYKDREDGIKRCISHNKEKVETLREDLEKSPSDALERTLRTTQSSLRVLRNELIVEDVIKTRSMKVFNERCWQVYSPPS